MSKTRSYDPAGISMIVGDIPITGFAEDTFLKIMRNKEAFSLKVGADGENTRVKSNDRSGRFEFTLQQASPSNDYLSSLATQDEKTSDAAKPIFCKDNLGTTIGKCQKGWVVKKPDSEFGNESTNRVWIIETGDLKYDVGGNVEL